MKNKKVNLTESYILVGGYPPEGSTQNPGGQVTATRLLVQYTKKENIHLHIIDTSQVSFPIPSFKARLVKAKNRILKFRNLIKTENISGAIIFSASGFSFYEKIVMSLIAKLNSVNSLLLIRSGHFIDASNSSTMVYLVNKLLLKVPTFIGAQGEKWKRFYANMNITMHKVKLIPNWIEIKKEHNYPPKNEKLVFLFAGLMDTKKGVLELFNVIEQHKDLEMFEFIFAGEGSLFEELKNRKIKNNLSNVTLLGWMYDQEMLAQYEKADVFVLPSHAEGFPNAILEALNYRLPIITTNVGGIADSVINDYNGYIFEPKDTDALYESIKILGNSKIKRMEFSRNSESILKKRHDLDMNCQLIFKTLNNKKIS